MCSIIGYLGSSISAQDLRAGFDKTISRGPDDTRRQTLHQQPGLRTSRQAVQHKDPRALVALLVFLARQQRGVVSAGQRAGNGHNVHLVCALVGGEPVRDIGAGGAYKKF